jgi:hypothetical protein
MIGLALISPPVISPPVISVISVGRAHPPDRKQQELREASPHTHYPMCSLISVPVSAGKTSMVGFLLQTFLWLEHTHLAGSSRSRGRPCHTRDPDTLQLL